MMETNVTDSCGCVFCDLDLKPTYSCVTEEWSHRLNSGISVQCSAPPKMIRETTEEDIRREEEELRRIMELCDIKDLPLRR